jgi:hypothetical protein
LATVLAAFFIPETFRSSQVGTVDSSRLRTKLAQMGEQFAEGRLGPALMVWIGQFCMLLLLFLLTSWTPTMAVRSGLSLQTAAVCGVILNLGGVVGALALRGAVNRHGPFVPAAVMVGVGALMIVLLGQTMGSTPLLMIVLLLVGITALGGQLICPAMIVELFPVHVRGAGAGCAFAAGRVGSIIGRCSAACCSRRISSSVGCTPSLRCRQRSPPSSLPALAVCDKRRHSGRLVPPVTPMYVRRIDEGTRMDETPRGHHLVRIGGRSRRRGTERLSDRRHDLRSGPRIQLLHIVRRP